MNCHVTLVPQFSPKIEKHAEIVISNLDDNNEVVLGRCDITGITDKRCSREHTKLKLDVNSNELVLTQLGSNPCSVSDCDGNTYILAKHDVKRLPIKKLDIVRNGKSILYLINKDLLYGYKLVVREETKTDCSSVKAKTSSSVSGSKRPQPTLDSYISKKIKKCDAGESKPAIVGEWTEPSSLTYMFTPADGAASSKIIGFDMDGTLIVTKSGAKWPKDKDDWKFWSSSIPKKLQALHSDGHRLVIFTNQAGISRGTQSAKDIQHKIECIINAAGIPMMAMIAGGKSGKYRKPLPGMWNHVISCNNGVQVDSSKCMYVGDAAGRVNNWKPGKKKDFSCSDRLFALNIGVPFATPEMFFNGEPEGKFELPEFQPSEVLKVKGLLDPITSKLVSDSQEIVIMVGFPGSGKSFVSTNHMRDYVRVNRDTLGSWQKCVAKCEAEVKLKKCVVVDNTNPDRESRARYVQVANKYNIPIRCFLMSTSYKQARHNEVYRQLTETKHKPINEMVVNSYKSKYTEPCLDEGFSEIVKVNFLPKFSNDEQKKLYSMYLLDK